MVLPYKNYHCILNVSVTPVSEELAIQTYQRRKKRNIQKERRIPLCELDESWLRDC